MNAHPLRINLSAHIFLSEGFQIGSNLHVVLSGSDDAERLFHDAAGYITEIGDSSLRMDTLYADYVVSAWKTSLAILD